MSDQLPLITHNLYFIEWAQVQDAYLFICNRFDEGALLVKHDKEQWPTWSNYEVVFWTLHQLEIFTQMDIVGTTHAAEWSFNELEEMED